jgi:hypothetical protein
VQRGFGELADEPARDDRMVGRRLLLTLVVTALLVLGTAGAASAGISALPAD